MSDREKTAPASPAPNDGQEKRGLTNTQVAEVCYPSMFADFQTMAALCKSSHLHTYLRGQVLDMAQFFMQCSGRAQGNALEGIHCPHLCLCSDEMLLCSIAIAIAN